MLKPKNPFKKYHFLSKKIEVQLAPKAANIIPFDWKATPFIHLNLSEKDKNIDGSLPLLEKFVSQKLKEKKTFMAVGGYLENRSIYLQSEVFTKNQTPRTVHLGIDIWLPEGTTFYPPLDSKVHSFQDNNSFGDYGGTIILEHEIGNEKFFTLYGHLSKKSLENLKEGMFIPKGEVFATLGSPEENVGWYPHLHFQIILDMLGRKGDFIGVTTPDEMNFYKNICPNPDILLSIPWELAL